MEKRKYIIHKSKSKSKARHACGGSHVHMSVLVHVFSRQFLRANLLFPRVFCSGKVGGMLGVKGETGIKQNQDDIVVEEREKITMEKKKVYKLVLTGGEYELDQIFSG